jgi:hypothetical protein
LGVGHEGRPTLLAVGDELNLVLVGMKTVQHRKVTFAGHTKRMGHALRDQAFNQQVAGHLSGMCGGVLLCHASTLFLN